jgi:hypothetical protein
VKESGSSGEVSESFFVSEGFSVNRWKFGGKVKFPLNLGFLF